MELEQRQYGAYRLTELRNVTGEIAPLIPFRMNGMYKTHYTCNATNNTATVVVTNDKHKEDKDMKSIWQLAGTWL
jgi:hypothetical protein